MEITRVLEFGKHLLTWDKNTSCSFGAEDGDGGHGSPEKQKYFHQATRRHTPKNNTSKRLYGKSITDSVLKQTPSTFTLHFHFYSD
jgi:hypothetical protein